ncbi:lipoprotein [Stenotrophomonas sp. HITSZ_GD]|uniref:LPS translocon maturation chaperone LptM n=1 Tax=Stenotrophomonas sp. HITSZ_GD TaxID=3037248 RepID=UPI00240E3ACE|nr:lipoprotein [Stenotrophomonas sp. HITSZ_GD]MDG2526019.1 lipoprotein [Stenotrophomonas sp. HITSZ_GD]
MSMKFSRSFRIAAAGAGLLLLAACGNKGPLVMPQKPVPVQAQPVPQPPSGETPPPTQTPTEAAQPIDGTPPATTDDNRHP